MFVTGRARSRVPDAAGVPEPDSSTTTPGPGSFAITAPRWRRLLGGIRAWMVVLPVDGAMLALPAIWAPGHLRAFLMLAVLGVVLITGGSRYRAHLHLSVLDELPALTGKILVAAALIAVVTALRHEQQAVTGFLAAAVWTVGLIVLGRTVTTQVILIARRKGIVSHRTLLVGSGPVGDELSHILATDRRYGLSLVGFVGDGGPDPDATELRHLGDLPDIETIVRSHDISVIMCADTAFPESELVTLLRQPACGRCDLLVVPRLHQFHTQVGDADHIGALAVMRVRTPSLGGPALLLKRGFDICVTLLALAVLWPLLAVAALAVRLEGGRGILFKQERVGRDGRVFRCLKFRSMRPASAAESATRWNIVDDDRIGPVGRILRRTSLDELPQLINVLKGDMTLVGPRPERPHFVRRFSAECPRYDQRLRMPAGLTGLAQVNGLRGDTPIADRTRFDNYYIEHWSLWLDVKILLRTISEVLLARGR
jgi:exopolysaccharide biosynthesis polyprenyl glycosylphosphotransferase